MRVSPKKQLFLIFGLLVLPLSLASELHELDIEALMEIEVEVASLFPESQLMAPATVSVLNRDQWKLRGARDGLRDLLDFEPGVVTYSSFGGNAVGIRGFSNNAFVVRGKGYQIDGIPINSWTFRGGLYGRSNLNPEVFDRLETIRGPGSALYGTDAFFGVFSLGTYDPKYDETEFSTVVSDHKVSEFTMRTSHGLAENGRLSAALSVTGQGAQNLSYTSRRLPGQVFERDETYQAGTGLLKWAFNRGSSNYKFTFMSHQWETDEAPGLVVFYGGAGAEDRMFADTRFNLWSFSSTRKLENDRELSWKLYQWSSNLTLGFEELNAQLSRVSGRVDERKGLSLRFKQNENAQRRTRYAAGFEIDNLHVPDQYSFVGAVLRPSDTFLGKSETVKSLYLQSRTRLKDDKFFLHLGGRLDKYPSFGSQFTPRAGLVHTPRKGRVWKFLYGNAFRAPSATEGFGTATVLGGPRVKPEEIDSYEGVYTQTSKKSLFSLTYFKSKLKNGILINRAAAPNLRYDNIGSSESTGFEFISKRKLDEEWTIEFNGSRITSMDLSSNSDFEGFPRHILNLKADYAPKNSDFLVWIGVRHMRDWKDGFGAFSAVAPLPSYNRVDLGVRYQVESNQEAYLWVRNLLDKDLRIPSVWDSEIGTPEAGRAIGVGWTYRF